MKSLIFHGLIAYILVTLGMEVESLSIEAGEPCSGDTDCAEGLTCQIWQEENICQLETCVK